MNKSLAGVSIRRYIYRPMHTPFFPALRARLAPMGRRLKPLRQQSLPRLEELFGSFLPVGLLSQAQEGLNSRDRIYGVRRTFWAFLYQVLNPHCPCREVVRQIQAFFCLHHPGRRVDAGTSAYCQARARLPLETLQRLRQAAASRVQSAAAARQPCWHGLHPKIIDGTTVSLPDTPHNQRAYPQSSSQKPGCGFPLLKLVGIFSLSSGALLDYAKGNKHQHEMVLLNKLLGLFKPNDLALADRGFSSYVLMALLLLRGTASLLRLHPARSTDLRQGRRLGKNDRLCAWQKPPAKPRYLPQRLWKLVPGQLPVRLLRVTLQVPGFRPRSVTLVTTLVDPKRYPAQDVAWLYVRRWRVELWFRDIKTTMGMEHLSCLAPAMAHKELEMFFIAYNLIRALASQALQAHQAPLDRMSFKGTVDACRQYGLAIAQARSKIKQRRLVLDLLEVIAADQVPQRPGRREPRALKRRHKNFPLLTASRDKYQEIRHRNHYRKIVP